MDPKSTATPASESLAKRAALSPELARQFRGALLLWGIFFVLAVLINGTVLFAMGADLRAWSQSPVKFVIFSFLVYGVLFLAAPLILVKGWKTVRQPAFLLPLCLTIAGVTVGPRLWVGPALALVILAYLHWRFDLSGYGIRSRGWKADVLAVLLMGLLGLVPVLLQSSFSSLSPGPAFVAALKRWFGNPASTVENLFYFGFLTERLSYRAGKWLTPLLIGLMYTAHEMSNPEYWYGGMNFPLIFVGVAIWAAVYLWRRSAVVIWLGDGLYRFVSNLF